MQPNAKRFVATVVLMVGALLAAGEDVVTNIAGLRFPPAGPEKIYRELRLEAEVCSVNASGGILVLADASGAEVVRVDAGARVKPGDRILLAGAHCRVRPESWGVSLAAAPLIDNDGLHGPQARSGKMYLESGRVPLSLKWFNASMGSALTLEWRPPGGAREKIPAENLLRPLPAGGWTNGLTWRGYEGSWSALPDFADLPVVAAGVAPDITLDVATRKDFVGLVFTGFLDVPRGGEYEFYLTSDDGAQLEVGGAGPKISVLASHAPAPPVTLKAGAVGVESSWAEVAGTVQQVMEHADGLELFLHTADGPVRVRLAGRAAAPALSSGAFLVVRGIAKNAFRPDGSCGFGLLVAASTDDVRVVASAPAAGTNALVTAAEVSRLSRAEAERGHPVRLRGVVTCDAPEIYYGSVIQDHTRGIYCFWPETNSMTGRMGRRPHFGEFWEIEGISDQGLFAPDIRVTNMTFLGEGELPVPVSPAWDQLLNGSLDTQLVEMQGVVTELDTNSVEFLTHGGNVRIKLPREVLDQLRPKKNMLVRLRGCLLAVWDESTHEVKLGEIRLGNVSVMTDQLEPTEPFEAPLKSVDDLLRFDVAAGSFQRVKMSGQITAKRGEEFFMLNGRHGMRFLPREPVAGRPGDMVEVVGLPELDGPSPVLREAVVRRTGSAPPPEPVRLNAADIASSQNDALRVRFDAILNDVRAGAGETLLDLQAGGNFFSARLDLPAAAFPVIEPGSRVELTGVYVSLTAPHRLPGRHLGLFEVLVASADDIRILARPPWWTLRRLLAVTGALFAVLILAALWITQLRRRVEERTEQLRHEISERERAEQQRIVQEERTRIAQDLHDDLGSSLTEISVLASAGSRSPAAAGKSLDLFAAIGEKSRRLVASLDAIVWAIDPKENTLQSLADYLAGYVENYLSTNDINCRFKMPDELPAVVVEGRQRHELYLVMKEALHNIVRHARATEVEFLLDARETALEITIRDNGCGFDPAARKNGHGLNNFHRRMTRLGGECVVTTRPGAGATVALRLPLAPSGHNAGPGAGESAK